MDTSYVEEVRLTSFKSFAEQVLPLGEMTLLVGRNGSGKSNALDGLWALSRLAGGEDIRDALDGGRDAAVRGGTAGLAPFGQSSFELGCTVRTGEQVVDLDVRITVEPQPQIVHERLALNGQIALETDPPTDSGDIVARWNDGKAGPHPKLTFRASRLLTPQILARVPATKAGQAVHLAAAQVITALRQVFVLDPVPHLMRGYVPERDILLRRDATNLSAAVADLLAKADTRERVCSAMSQLNEQEVVDVATTRSGLGDVMLTLLERFDGNDHAVPARVMSDGSLRFLAILVALLQAPTIESVPERLAAEDAVGQTTMVIEELENGLHASQAHLLIGLIRDEVKRRRVRVLATAHSPALLDALTKEEHHDVVVCQRGPGGRSALHRLLELPAYVDIVAGGGLGKAAERDQLRWVDRPIRRPSEMLAEVMGR